MVKIIQTDKITKGEVLQWIKKCNSLHSLQCIRVKTNKRIKSITSPKEDNAFAHIPIEQKREILKDLFVDAPVSNSATQSDKSEDLIRRIMRMNPYNNPKKHHKVINGRVCCIGHCCDWHFRSPKELEDYENGRN
jgi:hypothetical protein